MRSINEYTQPIPNIYLPPYTASIQREMRRLLPLHIFLLHWIAFPLAFGVRHVRFRNLSVLLEGWKIKAVIYNGKLLFRK